MITVTVHLPKYLYQWALNNFDAKTVDNLKIVFPAKGSPISNFLRNFLKHKFKRPVEKDIALNHGAIPVESEELLIQIPHFPGRDPQYYNYLSPVAEAQLRDLIRSRFDIDLFIEFSRLENLNMPIKDFIYSWMDANEIDLTEKNWVAVDKRLQIVRKKDIDRRRKKS